jgi:uncharacterized protein
MPVISRRTLFVFVVPVVCTYAIWAAWMTMADQWGLFATHSYMVVTMMFGSFIGGATPEGGGAVAFPVMTLVLSIPPEIARNFSLAIQSIGMGAATLWIIARRVPVEMTYLRIVLVSSVLGVLVSSFWIAPLVPASFSKMMFVTFWLAFGIALFFINHVRRRTPVDRLPGLNRVQVAELLAVGFVGGCFSGVLGNGVDICSFAYVTMKYNLSEKVATPTSVILMASNAWVGNLTHLFILRDVQSAVIEYWLVCIPVVLLGAPFGAYVMSRVPRLAIAWLLYVIIIVQFIGAVVIIRPTGMLALGSALVFLLGILLFFGLTLRSGRGKTGTGTPTGTGAQRAGGD